MVEVRHVLGPRDIPAIVEGVILIDGDAVGVEHQAGVGVPAAIEREGWIQIGAGEAIRIGGTRPRHTRLAFEGEGERGGRGEVELDPFRGVRPTPRGLGETIFIPAPCADVVGVNVRLLAVVDFDEPGVGDADFAELNRLGFMRGGVVGEERRRDSQRGKQAAQCVRCVSHFHLVSQV